MQRDRLGSPIHGTNSCCASPAAICRRLRFARAWGLAVYKSDTLAEMRRAQSLLAATLDVEIGLHIDYCRGWGLSETAMNAEPEAPETIAYTRFVLDRGVAGDRLDLEIALVPCMIGYAE